MSGGGESKVQCRSAANAVEHNAVEHNAVEHNAVEHIGRLARMSASGYRGRRFEPRQQYVVSLSKILNMHFFSRLSCEMSTRWGNLVKDVQCYKLFGGIALRNHAFSFFNFFRR